MVSSLEMHSVVQQVLHGKKRYDSSRIATSKLAKNFQKGFECHNDSLSVTLRYDKMTFF